MGNTRLAMLTFVNCLAAVSDGRRACGRRRCVPQVRHQPLHRTVSRRAVGHRRAASFPARAGLGKTWRAQGPRPLVRSHCSRPRLPVLDLLVHFLPRFVTAGGGTSVARADRRRHLDHPISRRPASYHRTGADRSSHCASWRWRWSAACCRAISPPSRSRSRV